MKRTSAEAHSGGGGSSSSDSAPAATQTLDGPAAKHGGSAGQAEDAGEAEASKVCAGLSAESALPSHSGFAVKLLRMKERRTRILKFIEAPMWI